MKRKGNFGGIFAMALILVLDISPECGQHVGGGADHR